jgi:hypothetical protein
MAARRLKAVSGRPEQSIHERLPAAVRWAVEAATQSLLGGYILARARPYITSGLSLLALAACGTTRRFVDQPRVTIDEPAKDARQAAADLFDSSTPYTVTLCEADRSSRDCKSGNTGITATGVGGLFLPLTLHVTGMVVSRQSQSLEGWTIDATFQSKVDAISPLCRTAHGQIVSRDNNTLSVQIRNFYCNWVVIGNVVVSADLSIDNIDLKDRAFTGFYKVTFHGTGNAAGSGYYKAVILPRV